MNNRNDLIMLAVAENYPYAEISNYWSEDDVFSYITLVVNSLYNQEDGVITLNRGGVTIVISLRFSAYHRSAVSRLRLGLPVNRVIFDLSELLFFDETEIVPYLLSLIDAVL